MRIKQQIMLDFQDVLILPKRSTLSSRSEVVLHRDLVMKHSGAVWTGVPILASNMDTVGSLKMVKKLAEHDLGVCLHKFIEDAELVNHYTTATDKQMRSSFYSMGITKKDYEKFERIQEATGNKITQVCIDVANGYQESFVKFVEEFRLKNPKITIIAGNVVTSEMTEQLILAGADIVKVGIGSGSACLTRRVAGVGCPQLSAILECADRARGMNAMICSDGGCTSPGDVAKAFAAGADFVMLGGMLAGYDECDGQVIEKNGKKYLKFHGMSSKEAMLEHYKGMPNHRASEGREVLVECKGSVENAIYEILGGVRSTCSYVGAKKLKHLPLCTTFIQVNRQLNQVFEKD